VKVIRAHALVLTAATALTASLVAAAPSHADPLPPQWGELTGQTAFMSVIGRVDGHMAHRRGNQHVFNAITREEEVVIGEVLDWKCPAGVTAPLGLSEPTTCVNKGFFSVDSDYATYNAGAPLVIKWSPQLKYMALRSPATLTENYVESPTVRHGTVSIRARATGPLKLEVFPDDYFSWLTRTHAQVVGGKFFGIPWLSMDSVEVTEDFLGLYSYYDLIQP